MLRLGIAIVTIAWLIGFAHVPCANATTRDLIEPACSYPGGGACVDQTLPVPIATLTVPNGNSTSSAALMHRVVLVRF